MNSSNSTVYIGTFLTFFEKYCGYKNFSEVRKLHVTTDHLQFFYFGLFLWSPAVIFSFFVVVIRRRVITFFFKGSAFGKII